MPSDANAMGNKGNLVLCLDKDLVEKSKSLGFNLSKTFENHLKHLMTQFSTCNPANNINSINEDGVWFGFGIKLYPQTKQLTLCAFLSNT